MATVLMSPERQPRPLEGNKAPRKLQGEHSLSSHLACLAVLVLADLATIALSLEIENRTFYTERSYFVEDWLVDKKALAPPLLLGLNLAFTELGDFMPISTRRHAAPLTSMIFGRVVKVQHALPTDLSRKAFLFRSGASALVVLAARNLGLAQTTTSPKEIQIFFTGLASAGLPIA